MTTPPGLLGEPVAVPGTAAVPRNDRERAMQAIEHARTAAEASHAAAERVASILEAQQRPARMETIAIAAATGNPATSTPTEPAASIALLNPTSFTVWIGAGGSQAIPNGRVPSAPPNTFLVLPIDPADVELAVDPTALAGNTAVVFLFRFKTVQAPYLGKGV